MVNKGYNAAAALVEPEINTNERCYFEVTIGKVCKSDFKIGVSGSENVPSYEGSDCFENRKLSCVYRASDSSVYFEGDKRNIEAGDSYGELYLLERAPSTGDRIGLLVERSSMFLYVNGTQVGGVMTANLPPTVRFLVELSSRDDRIGINNLTDPLVRAIMQRRLRALL